MTRRELDFTVDSIIGQLVDDDDAARMLQAKVRTSAGVRFCGTAPVLILHIRVAHKLKHVSCSRCGGVRLRSHLLACAACHRE